MNVADLWAKLSLRADKSSFAAGERMMSSLKTAVVAFASYEGLKGLYELVNTTTEAAVHATRLGQQLGISGDAVQEFGYAAKVSGVDAEQLNIGMGKLAKGLYAAKEKGTGPLVDAFGKLGLSMNDPAIKSGDLGQSIEVIADKFSKMPDGADKAALAMELFGKSGKQLIPFLDQGKSGIEALRAEAEALGLVIDGPTREKFEAFERDQRRLGAVWDGIKNQLATALLPAFKDMAEGVLQWAVANKELIKTNIQRFAAVLEKGLRFLGKAVMYVFKAFTWLSDHASFTKVLLIALAATFGVLAIASIASAVASAAAWVLAMLPILAVIAAVTLVALIVDDLWHYLNGDKKTFFGAMQKDAEAGLGHKGVLGFIQDIIFAIENAVNKLREFKDDVQDFYNGTTKKSNWNTEEDVRISGALKDDALKARHQRALNAGFGAWTGGDRAYMQSLPAGDADKRVIPQVPQVQGGRIVIPPVQPIINVTGDAKKTADSITDAMNMVNKAIEDKLNDHYGALKQMTTYSGPAI